MYPSTLQCVAFDGSRLIASGEIAEVAASVRAHLDHTPDATLVILDATTSRPIELDLRGTVADVLARLSPVEPETPAEPAPRGPGRPKLGVVAREVTLLPRHWEWLASQPGGASVTLRKLVETARKANAGEDTRRAAREATFRFMNAVAGNEAEFDEVNRALFAGDHERFEALTEVWPVDVRDHARRLAAEG